MAAGNETITETSATSTSETGRSNGPGILPDRYDGLGDFRHWLRHFNACADASSWSDEDRLKKLPAFLRGRAATHLYALTTTEQETYTALTSSLQKSLCPPVEREKNYRLFESRCLRPGEDPAVFRWELEELLRLSDSELNADQMRALTARQFMRGFPSDLQIKLLENDPVPGLETMVTFAQNRRAIDRSDLPAPNTQSSAAVSTPPTEIAALTALVEQLATDQRALHEQLQSREQQTKEPVRRPVGPCYSCGRRCHIARNCRNGNRPLTCCKCNLPGQIARDCTMDLNSHRATQYGR